MAIQKAWRQGDVGVIESSIPKGAKEVAHDGVLAYGETTGHKHQLVGGRVRYFRDANNDLYFKVESRFVSLNHGSTPTARVQQDGHCAHELPTGTYKVVHQREYDWQGEMLRHVED